MKTVGDLFSGGGGWSLGAKAAGLEPIWAIEKDAGIAEVYKANLGDHVIVDDVAKVDVGRLEAPDILLASPPCQSHSIARSNKLAPRDDAEVGVSILNYVRILRPSLLVIENVEGWKRSHSFKAIFHGLHELGYFINVQVLNAADFGVPQTRRRLILRASRRGFLSSLPAPTPWLGWYQAVEDLIPSLPESHFADWQLKRLPAVMNDLLVDSAGFDDGGGRLPIMREANQPAGTIVSNYSMRKLNAFLVGVQGENSDYLKADECAPTISASHTSAKYRAFIVPGGNSTSFSPRLANEPVRTIESVNRVGNIPRAWLSQGRVVSMTPRALARFQSIPNGYQFPEGKGSNALACKIIGNAVPPKLAEGVLSL